MFGWEVRIGDFLMARFDRWFLASVSTHNTLASFPLCRTLLAN
jgi:hypothetical protein